MTRIGFCLFCLSSCICLIAATTRAFGADTKAGAVDIPTSPWLHVCKESKETGKDTCQIIQQILEKKSKKIVLSGAVRLTGTSNTPALVLQLPHGMYIPAGIAIQIDQATIKKTIAQTCDQRGCFASIAVDDATLAKLKSGKQLVIAFKNLQKQTIAVSLALDGFSQSYETLISAK